MGVEPTTSGVLAMHALYRLSYVVRTVRYCDISELGLVLLIPDHVAQSVERRASIPEVVGSIPTVVGRNFQPAQCGFHSE